MSNGKGDKRRPMKVSYKEFLSNWEKAFSKKKPENKKEGEDNAEEQM